MRPVYYGATDIVGVYRVERGAETVVYAVNMLDKNESAIAPAESLQLGKGRVMATQGGVVQTKELWRWFIAVALGVLALAWWIYSKRAWV